jgi:hypothetical protein
MKTIEFIKKLEKLGLVTKRPKPIYVFLLFFAYLLIWIVIFVLYLKFEMTALKFWVIILGILTLLTLVHAILHRYVVKVLKNQKEETS